MSLTVKHSGEGTPAFRWTSQHMAAFAQAVRAHLVRRTFDQGIGDTGQKHRGYSTRPLKLYRRSSTGRALSPRSGGVSFKWVRGPRQPGGGYDRSRIGQDAGRIYEGGYKAYKLANRRGLDSTANAAGPSRTGTEVDLVLSGRLSRSLRVTSTTRTTATIAITGDARSYGGHVDAARPFMGIAPGDPEVSRLLDDAAAAAITPRKAGPRGTR